MTAMHAGILKLIVAVAVVVASALVPAGTSAAPSAETGLVVDTVEESPSEIRASWSQKEMLEAADSPTPSPLSNILGPIGLADPVPQASTTSTGDFAPEDPTVRPLRTHGKVFFRSQGQSYSCSGTLIDSARRDVVMTAGHCVYDRKAKRFVEDLAFVPAWNGRAESAAGRSPFGTWPATDLVTTDDFRLAGQLGADVAFFRVAGEPGATIGARKITFGQDSVGRKVTILGYPAKPEALFDGQEMRGCASTIVGRDTGRGAIFPAALRAEPCRMGAGSSGGGWVTPGGVLTSIVSYGYCPAVSSLCDATFGPVLGELAKSLYNSEEIGGSRKPGVTVARASVSPVRTRTVSFEVGGSGSTPVATWCRVDSAPYRKCKDSVTYRNLAPGRHVFRVRAKDQTGRTSTERGLVFTVRGR
jgi:hypothetical protein